MSAWSVGKRLIGAFNGHHEVRKVVKISPEEVLVVAGR